MHELYALNALEAEDHATLAAHLASGCRQCEAAAAQARDLVAQLAWLSPGILPPARLRQNLLRLAQAESC